MNSTTNAKLWSNAFAWDGADNITGITDQLTASNSQVMTYDALDRLTKITGNFGTTKREDFVLDANTNRLKLEQRSSATAANPTTITTYALVAGTNRLASITTGAAVRTLAYDAAGNVVTDTRPVAGAPVVTSYGYDGMQRMVNVTSGSTTELYTYNADGERVQVSAPSVLRRFVYDGAGRTIGEYGTSATDVKAEHIWLVPEAANDNQAALFAPEVPLAQEPLAVASGTTVTWVHADHLGTPVLLTTATGTQANRYTRAAFGQRLTSAAAAPTTALSFPGQIIDANSTSATRHYNYMRHYDPTLGRYLAAGIILPGERGVPMAARLPPQS